MTATELAKLVAAMRQAQKDYFRHRDGTSLDKSKGLEKQVDEAVKDILDPRPLLQ